MERDWRRRDVSTAGTEGGSGYGVGRRSLSEAAESIGSSASIASSGAGRSARGFWPAATGAGFGSASANAASTATPSQQRPNKTGALPRLNLFASKQGEGPDGEGQDADREHEAEGASSDGEGQARGWGISGIVDGVKGAVTAAKGAALAVAGVPMISHETHDRAPGASNTRTTVGVGEMITFTSNMPGKWKADKGARGFPKKATGERFMWAAMSTAGSAKITFEPEGEGQPKLEVVIQVIAPTVDYVNARAVAFPGQAPGMAGVQMETDVTFGPNTVSFANTMWWEKAGPATGATGYFKDHVTKRKLRLPYHRPNPDDVQIDSTNSGIVDAAGWWDFNGPYSDGSFVWVIPTYYRVVDDRRYLISNVHQTCTITADGTMTVTKGSSSMSRRP
jgi:hypothetical protein